MFVDLVGSTRCRARLDPEEMREVLRAYQNAVAGEVARFEGHVAKFMGDGVLAYFGWPRAHEDEAERAVRAGLALVAAVGRLRAPAASRWRPGRHRDRAGRGRRPRRRGRGAGGGGRRRDAEPRRPPAGAGRARARWWSPRARGGCWAGCSSCATSGAQTLKGFAEPVPALRGRRRAAPLESRFEARTGPALTPLVGREQELALLLERWRAGRGRRGPGGAARRRGRHRQVAHGPGAARRSCRASRTPRCATSARPTTPTARSIRSIQQLERAAGFARRRHRRDASSTSSRRCSRTGRRTADGGAAARRAARRSTATARYPPLDLTPAAAARSGRSRRCSSSSLGLARARPVLWRVRGRALDRPDHARAARAARSTGSPSAPRAAAASPAGPTFRPRSAGHPHVTRLTLNRLGRGRERRRSSARLTRRQGAAAGRCSSRSSARTDGVPLFVEELTKAVLESGCCARPRPLRARRPAAALAIPTTLHDSLMARLDRLAAGQGGGADRAPCIGREFDYALLAALSPAARAAS